ncbi:MAG: hypothetical protein ABMA14_25205 [Hyphomonadaceae bacterium]
MQLEGRLAPEFLLFLRDLESHRTEKFAVECLIDQLRQRSVTIPAGIARDILQRCEALGIDQGRRGAVPGLLDFSPASASADADRAKASSLEDLIAADDPVAFGKANGAGELLIVRALREKFGFSFDDAMA